MVHLQNLMCFKNQWSKFLDSFDPVASLQEDLQKNLSGWRSFTCLKLSQIQESKKCISTTDQYR